MEIEEGVGYDEVLMMKVENGGYSTPKHSNFQIPSPSICPPPPKKKKKLLSSAGKNRAPPQNGYFHPPDLELFFASFAPPQASCA